MVPLEWICLVVAVCLSPVDSSQGVLSVANGSSVLKVCMTFSSEQDDIFKDSLDLAPVLAWLDLRPSLACGPQSGSPRLTNNTVAVVERGNCTFAEKALYAQEMGVGALIIVSNESLSDPILGGNNDTLRRMIHVPVAFLLTPFADKISSFGGAARIQLTKSVGRPFDPSMVVIFVLAVSCVLAGSYWTGLEHQRKQDAAPSEPPPVEPKDGTPSLGNVESATVPTADVPPRRSLSTMVSLLIAAVVLVAILLLLYFFYPYMVYVLIAIFSLGGVYSLYLTVAPFVERMPCCVHKFELRSWQLDARKLLLVAVCLGFVIWWLVIRLDSYSWILQDVIGVAYCLSFIRLAQFPNFKYIFGISVALFLYDVFFVFITPLFTQSGKSIMEAVATGSESGSKEMVPLAFRIPKMLPFDGECSIQPGYSLLGFGDIMVPGFLTGYCSRFDRCRSSPFPRYLLVSCIAYAIGLCLCFVALLLMDTAQPALLYLVPCCLSAVFVVAALHKECDAFWSGTVAVKANDGRTASSVRRGDENEHLVT